MNGRAHHDLGGVERFACEPIDVELHALDEFDRTVDAIRQILGAEGVMSADELRRGVEALPEADHHRLTCYQRWLRSARPAERRALHHLAFPQAALRPDGRADVELLVGIFEHWPAPA